MWSARVEASLPRPSHAPIAQTRELRRPAAPGRCRRSTSGCARASRRHGAGASARAAARRVQVEKAQETPHRDAAAAAVLWATLGRARRRAGVGLSPGARVGPRGARVGHGRRGRRRGCAAAPAGRGRAHRDRRGALGAPAHHGRGVGRPLPARRVERRRARVRRVSSPSAGVDRGHGATGKRRSVGPARRGAGARAARRRCRPPPTQCWTLPRRGPLRPAGTRRNASWQRRPT